MKLKIKSELDYNLPECTDVLLQIEAAMIPEQRVHHAHIDLPRTEHFARVSGHDSIGDRIWLRHEGRLTVRYEAEVDVQRLGGDIAGLKATPPHMLPGETIQYLMPSRFCPSDRFQSLAEADFGSMQGGEKIMAMSDWIHAHISYTPGSSNAETGAMQTYIDRKGVCRDFAHLLITLARASTIPARFVSVYGVGVSPQDFHAIAEVFLDGTWYMVDATGMSASDRMAKIGVGRDATDVSFLTSYAYAEMTSQSVEVTPV